MENLWSSQEIPSNNIISVFEDKTRNDFSRKNIFIVDKVSIKLRNYKSLIHSSLRAHKQHLVRVNWWVGQQCKHFIVILDHNFVYFIKNAN